MKGKGGRKKKRDHLESRENKKKKGQKKKLPHPGMCEKKVAGRDVALKLPKGVGGGRRKEKKEKNRRGPKKTGRNPKSSEKVIWVRGGGRAKVQATADAEKNTKGKRGEKT